MEPLVAAMCISGTAAFEYAVTTVATLAGTRAAVPVIAALLGQELEINALQDFHHGVFDELRDHMFGW